MDHGEGEVNYYAVWCDSLATVDVGRMREKELDVRHEPCMIMSCGDEFTQQ